METPPLACPVCHQELVRTDLGGIPVASCHEHGRWLGHTEAQALVDGLEKEHEREGKAKRRRRRRRVRRRLAAREAKERQAIMRSLFGTTSFRG